MKKIIFITIVLAVIAFFIGFFASTTYMSLHPPEIPNPNTKL